MKQPNRKISTDSKQRSHERGDPNGQGTYGKATNLISNWKCKLKPQ